MVLKVGMGNLRRFKREFTIFFLESLSFFSQLECALKDTKTLSFLRIFVIFFLEIF